MAECPPLQVVDDELLATLECPICHETTLPPVFRCPVRHIICNRCRRPEVDRCPLCRRTDPFISDPATDRMLAKYLFHCSHPGCPELVRCQDKNSHEASCKRRPVQIVNLTAQTSVTTVRNNLVRYELAKSAVGDTFFRSSIQYLSDNDNAASVHLTFRRFQDHLDVFCYIHRGTAQPSIRLTEAMRMRNGERREKLPVILSDSNSTVETSWHIADLPDTIALEIALELA